MKAIARHVEGSAMSPTTLYGEMQEAYLALIRTFPFRPIRSEGDLDEAMEVLDALVDKDTLTAAEADYLAVLSDLVEQYEAGAHAIPSASDAELLQHLLEAQAATPDRVAQATGMAIATLAAVLDGTQRLTREQIGTLARYFQVSPSVFAFGE
jgi:HTH-type transcriptional regulator/antitoxin HigA